MVFKFLLGDVKSATLGCGEELLSEGVWIPVEGFPGFTLLFPPLLWFSARERTKISCLMSSSNTCIPIFSCCGASFSWCFSCRCLALNWPFLTWRRFGCFKPSLFFLLTSLPNFSRHRLWTISQNALSCFAVDPLRRIVRVVESSWSSRAQAELWFPLGHWILTLLGNAPGCAGAAMGSGTLWWLSGFEIPSFDLFYRRGLRCCLHLRVGWMRRLGWMVRFLCSPSSKHWKISI